MMKKIMIFMLLLSMLVGLGVPVQAKAAPVIDLSLYDEFYSQFEAKFIESGRLLSDYPYYVDYFYEYSDTQSRYIRLYSSEPIILTKNGHYAPNYTLCNISKITSNNTGNIFRVMFKVFSDKENVSFSNDSSPGNLGTSDLSLALSCLLGANHVVNDENGTFLYQDPYSFYEWCRDAELNCTSSSNESSSVIPFFYEPNNYNYIVSKNTTSSSTSNIYNLLMIQKSDGLHFPYHFQVGDIDYLGVAGSFGDISRFTVRKFNYDPDGDGWKLIIRHDIGELPFDNLDFTFDENTVLLYSDTDIYADSAASSVWQPASTEYYNVEIPEVEIPTITTIPSGGSGSSVGGQAKPGGMLDFIITFFTLVWTKLFAVEVPVDGYQISFQAIVIFGVIAGVLIWLGKISFGKKG